MTAIILIRHGETDWNVEGRYQGQADPPLNHRGIEQARLLAKKLEENGIDLMYSSPLKRAQQTANIICNALKVPLNLEPGLMEINQGDWQTRLRSEIEELYPEVFSKWETEPWNVTPPNGEHLTQVQTRVNAAVANIIGNHPHQKVGVVTHRIPIALIKLQYQDLEPDIVRTIHLPNTYYEEINIQESNPKPGIFIE